MPCKEKFFFLLFITCLDAAEFRGIASDTLEIREKLSQKQALFLGEYSFTDWIYKRSTSADMRSEYIRIRIYPQIPIVITHKKRQEILFQAECSQIEEVIQLIPVEFLKELSFSRRGWEYRLGEMKIYVEEIENLSPSVEIISPSTQDVNNLFEYLQISKILEDPVPEWVRKSIGSNLSLNQSK